MNQMFWWTVLITFISGVCGTGMGGMVSALFRKDSKRVVSLLLSFAAGVMLAVVCFDLIESAIHPEHGSEMPVYLVILGIAFGYGLVALLNNIIDRKTNPEISHIDSKHPKTADDLDELIHSNHLDKHINENSSLFVAGVIMAFAIALHNLPEGMVIGAMYSTETVEEIITSSGFIMAVIIGLHNIPEGMAVSVPLIAGGMKKGKAILITALSGLPTVFGAMLGFWLGTLGPVVNALALSFASGAMLYVVFGELLPESILMWKSKLPSVAIMTGLMLGVFLVM
jgi:Predicted divalent heavy-metal cations transporter